MNDLEHWRSLRGDDLNRALLAACWYARPNDLIGGWSVMPVDQPPSSGYPEVGCFLSRPVAEHIAALHNAGLDAG
ncbi:hypothetical protein Ade02nite_21290 [Paractinoplanes deccanensis]|uniref:Uncharacterized protein n=1 Tax=Paractinoplanes deccanensis TaxID=113561 RepID=A0ABQ3Y0H5_9ACTN|nr:hypothetical protein [Actinoplanes deccanensis]GID73488.1 hypothetical protein Ade02nite_21290 [Actinoplanes deccanensis]